MPAPAAARLASSPPPAPPATQASPATAAPGTAAPATPASPGTMRGPYPTSPGIGEGAPAPVVAPARAVAGPTPAARTATASPATPSGAGLGSAMREEVWAIVRAAVEEAMGPVVARQRELEARVERAERGGSAGAAARPASAAPLGRCGVDPGRVGSIARAAGVHRQEHWRSTDVRHGAVVRQFGRHHHPGHEGCGPVPERRGHRCAARARADALAPAAGLRRHGHEVDATDARPRLGRSRRRRRLRRRAEQASRRHRRRRHHAVDHHRRSDDDRPQPRLRRGPSVLRDRGLRVDDLGSSSASRGTSTHRQHAAERRAVGPREVGLGDEQESHHHGARREEDVERDDVHDDRREDHERERHEAIREEHHACGHLGRLEQREEVARTGEPAEERQGACRHRRLRQKVQEAVQAEHEEDEAEEDASDVGRTLRTTFM